MCFYLVCYFLQTEEQIPLPASTNPTEQENENNEGVEESQKEEDQEQTNFQSN